MNNASQKSFQTQQKRYTVLVEFGFADAHPQANLRQPRQASGRGRSQVRSNNVTETCNLVNRCLERVPELSLPSSLHTRVRRVQRRRKFAQRVR